MRKRQRARRAIAAYKKLERELDDAVDADRARRSREDDAAVAEKARPRSRSSAEEARAPAGRGAAFRRGRRQRHLPRGPRRRRRHREPGLGRDARAHVHRAGRSSAATRSRSSSRAPAKRPASSPRPCEIKGENAYGWLKTEAACTAWCASRPTTATRAATPASPRLGLPGGRRQHRDRHQRERLPHRHLSLVGRRRPARQHDGLGRAHHAYADRHRGGEPAGALADQEPRDRLGAC